MSLVRNTVVALSLITTVTIVNAQTPKNATPAKQTAPAPKAKLPAAVEAAFKKAYPNATIKNVSSETEDGKLQYEVESMNGGHSLDVNYLADGTMVVAEEGIDAAAVPAPAMTAFKARYPKATVTSYEKVTRGKTISYEFIMTGADVKEAEIAPDGTFINPKPVKK